MTAKTYAKIVDNIVVDIHLVEPEFLSNNPDRYSGTWIETNDIPCAIGWYWDGNSFISLEAEEL